MKIQALMSQIQYMVRDQPNSNTRKTVSYPLAVITGGSTSNVFFFFVGVGLGFFGVSGAAEAGVAAGVSFIGISPGSVIPFGLGGAFFLAAFVDGFDFST